MKRSTWWRGAGPLDRVVLYLGVHGGALHQITDYREELRRSGAFVPLHYTGVLMLWTEEQPLTVQSALATRQWVAGADLAHMVGRIKAAELIVILDSCNAAIEFDAFSTVETSTVPAAQRRAVVASGSVRGRGVNSLAVPVWKRVSIEVYCPVEFGRFNHDTAETPMTRTSMDLSGFLAKHDQSDFMRVPAGNVLHLIMEADVEGLIGAGRHERADNRTTWRTTRRNGYRESALDTRMGTLNLKVPKLRHGSDFPGFPEPRKISGKALVSLVQEAWISGVSTRKVDDPVQAMGIAGMSRSTVSRLCKDIDERVHGFLNRPVIPALTDYNRWAHSRHPIDMMRPV